MMAGRPDPKDPAKDAALRAAGVDQFLFAGTDAVAVLRELHEKFDG